MKKTQPLLLGAHTSIVGGIDQAFYRGAEIGCTAIQIFTHSNRQWAMRPLTPETISKVQEAREKTGIASCIVHASYLINLGSQSVETIKKSKETLEKELINCNELSIPYLVLHPGSGGPDPLTCLKQIAELLDEVLEKDQGTTSILLENTAGQGTQVGYMLDHLAFLKKETHHHKRIEFCIDTCHLWTSGYDFSTEKAYEDTLQKIDKTLGLTHIKAIHLNDSKKGLGSRVDRHEDIGKGTLGLEPFRFIMNDERLSLVPKILETPADSLEDYARNMKILKLLIKEM